MWSHGPLRMFQRSCWMCQRATLSLTFPESCSVPVLHQRLKHNNKTRCSTKSFPIASSSLWSFLTSATFSIYTHAHWRPFSVSHHDTSHTCAHSCRTAVWEAARSRHIFFSLPKLDITHGNIIEKYIIYIKYIYSSLMKVKIVWNTSKWSTGRGEV